MHAGRPLKALVGQRSMVDAGLATGHLQRPVGMLGP
jgi:hypothetical protein